MAFVSIYTEGKLLHPYNHPVSRDFYDMGYRVMRQASLSGNLIKDLSSPNPPLRKEPKDGEYPALTLSVWKNLETLHRFTYSGKHSQALRNKKKWMDTSQKGHGTYIIWWTEKVKDVTWEEAFKRYEYYLEHGPTPYAFDFKHAFNEEGEPFVWKT